MSRAVLAAGLIVLGGCAGRAAEAPPAASESAAATNPEQAIEGLEVVWWITDDTAGRVGEVLARFQEPPEPPDHTLRDRWRRSGLRLVRAPSDQRSLIERALPALTPRYRLPIGWTSAWTEVFRGRRLPAGHLVVGERPREFPAGLARVIARCWPVPGASGSPRVHFELALQHEPETAPKAIDPFAPPAPIDEASRGEILRDLTMSVEIDAGSVYVLTCEAPAVTWREPAPRDEHETGFSPEAIDPAPSARPAQRPAGPQLPAPPTLGEASMQVEPGETQPRRLRTVITLTINSKRDFRLLR